MLMGHYIKSLHDYKDQGLAGYSAQIITCYGMTAVNGKVWVYVCVCTCVWVSTHSHSVTFLLPVNWLHILSFLSSPRIFFNMKNVGCLSTRPSGDFPQAPVETFLVSEWKLLGEIAQMRATRIGPWWAGESWFAWSSSGATEGEAVAVRLVSEYF